MKTRRLVVTLEIETAMPLVLARKACTWQSMIPNRSNQDYVKVLQAQANVVRRQIAYYRNSK